MFNKNLINKAFVKLFTCYIYFQKTGLTGYDATSMSTFLMDADIKMKRLLSLIYIQSYVSNS